MKLILINRRGVIYKYTNLKNGKVYIGQTLNETKRREKWRNLNSPYAGEYINRARAKYGLSSFKYEIISEILSDDEDILKETLNILEVKYISLYRAKEPSFGYNLSDGGKSGVGQVISKETREKLRKAHKSPRPYSRKKIVQLTKLNEVVKVWEGVTEAAKSLGLGHSNISAALRKSHRHKTCGGYKWEYYEDNFKKNS